MKVAGGRSTKSASRTKSEVSGNGITGLKENVGGSPHVLFSSVLAQSFV